MDSENNTNTAYQKIVVIVGMVTSFISTFAGSALNLAIPDMGRYFHMSAAGVGWIVTAFILVVAAFSVPIGKLADTTNRKNVMIIGIILFGVMSIFCIMAPNAPVLLAARVIQALGASMIYATNYSLAVAAYPPSQRGRVIGILISGTYVGLVLGPVLGGILNTNYGWQSIFWFIALVTLIGLAVTLIGIRGRHPGISAAMDRELQGKTQAGHSKPDVVGTILFALTTGPIIFGLTELNSMKFGWVFLVAGAGFGVLYAKAELKAEDPLIDVRVLARNKIFTFSNLAALFNYCATFAIVYLGSIYLQVALGYSSQKAGLILIIQTVFMAVLSPFAGRLSDRVSPAKLASCGMAICAVSLAVYIFIRSDWSIVIFGVVLAGAGIGIALFSSPNTSVIMGCVPPSQYGMATTVASTMRTTGQSFAIAIVTIVVSAQVGTVSLDAISCGELERIMHICFAVYTAMCVAGIFLSLRRH